jgi:hypothetical protein
VESERGGGRAAAAECDDIYFVTFYEQTVLQIVRFNPCHVRHEILRILSPPEEFWLDFLTAPVSLYDRVI